MPFIESTYTAAVGGYGPAYTDYSDCYAYANLKVVTRNNKVDWQITMKTPVNGSGKIPAIKLEFSIDGQGIFDKYYTNYGQGFPCKNGSSASGTITLKDEFDTSIPVSLKVGVSTRTPQYSANKTVTRIFYTNVGKGTVRITDNYDNTFKLLVTKGADGTNNPAALDGLRWGYTSNCVNVESSDMPNPYSVVSILLNEVSLSITTPTAATRTVYLTGSTYGTYGVSATASTSVDIRQYVAPSVPGKPTLSTTTGKITLQTPWTFTWAAAEATNTSSPVMGYRVRLYKNGQEIRGLALAEDDSIIKINGSTNAFFDTDSTNTTVVVNPAELGFAVGDTVSLGVIAYTRYGLANDGSKLFKPNEPVQKSAEVTIINSSAVFVKVLGGWKPGTVYIKAGNVWKPAESVNVNVDGKWEISK